VSIKKLGDNSISEFMKFLENMMVQVVKMSTTTFVISVLLLILIMLSGCGNTYNITSGRSAKIKEFSQNPGDTVYFAYDSAELSNHSKEHLDKQIAWLKVNRELKAIIEGHCDERGTHEYNMALGESRASAVKDYMLTKAIDENRLDIISYGKARPVSNGHTEDSWKLNRRAVTFIKKYEN
jgi:peptidoglycan-associated lipoprotein